MNSAGLIVFQWAELHYNNNNHPRSHPLAGANKRPLSLAIPTGLAHSLFIGHAPLDHASRASSGASAAHAPPAALRAWPGVSVRASCRSSESTPDKRRPVSVCLLALSARCIKCIYQRLATVAAQTRNSMASSQPASSRQLTPLLSLQINSSKRAAAFCCSKRQKARGKTSSPAPALN